MIGRVGILRHMTPTAYPSEFHTKARTRTRRSAVPCAPFSHSRSSWRTSRPCSINWSISTTRRTPSTGWSQRRHSKTRWTYLTTTVRSTLVCASQRTCTAARGKPSSYHSKSNQSMSRWTTMKSSFSWPVKTLNIATGKKDRNFQKRSTIQMECSSVTGQECTAFHVRSFPSTTSLAPQRSTLSRSSSISAAESTPTAKNSKKMSKQSAWRRLKRVCRQTSSQLLNGNGAEVPKMLQHLDFSWQKRTSQG